jgi:hypothetical protein
MREISNASGSTINESNEAADEDVKKNESEYEFLPGNILNCLPMTMKPYTSTIKKGDAICTNGHFFFWRSGDTLFKANIAGLNALNFKIIDKVSVDWHSDAKMLFFKDKLFIRHKDLDREKAFVVYDANTLKHLEDYEIKIEDPSKALDTGDDEEDAKSENENNAPFTPTTLEDFQLDKKCPTCTFANGVTAMECEMCTTDLSGVEPSGAPV